jgi:ribonuclease HI
VFLTEPYTSNQKIVKTVPGYITYQFPSDAKPVKAALLVKNTNISTLGYTKYSDSHIAIAQVTEKTGAKIYLVSLYVEPRNDVNNTLRKLEEFLQETKGSKHIIGGDLNGWHTLWGCQQNNTRGCEIADLVTAHGLKVCNIGHTPTFETVTHGQPRSSIVDITFASNVQHHNPITITNWKVTLEVCPSSDHNALTYTIATSKHKTANWNKKAKLSTFKYDTSGVKWERIREDIERELQGKMPEIENINNSGEDQIDCIIASFTGDIQKMCDELLPRSAGPPQKPPWWNEDLNTLKKKVIKNHHALNKAVRRRLPLTDILGERDSLRKRYADECCTASTSSFRDFCERQKKEDVWSVTNRIMRTKPVTQPPATMTLPNGTHTKNSKEIADALLNNFHPDDTEDSHAQRAMRQQTLVPPDTDKEPPFTTGEVIGALETINHKKAPGSDHLTADICLQVTKIFPETITAIMNRCLLIGYFPDYWKTTTTKIIPKPNKDDYAKLSSFRPIGLVKVFGKLLEKLTINRLVHHMHTNNQVVNRQFGFRLQTSTTHAIIHALKLIEEGKNEGEQVLAVSLDIRAAFDNAWWPAIFQRLKRIGCPKNIYNILLSYVTNRQVQLAFADYSAQKTVSRGCIQGSVVGPVLWNLVLDDLLDKTLTAGCHSQAYADDVLLICRAKTVEELEANTNLAIEEVVAWGAGVKLEFGKDKTQIVAFTNGASRAKVTIGGETVPMVSEIKYLGVIIDNKLQFTRHVLHTIEKARKLYYKLQMFIRPTWGVHPENIRTIYKQVIEPIMTYASSIWQKALKHQYIKDKLLSLQRLMAIKITHAFRTINTPLAITLAQLTPLPAKIKYAAELENTRLRGVSSLLPEDLEIEKPIPPSEMMHPAIREGISFRELQDGAEVERALADHPEDSWVSYTDGSRHDNTVGAAFVTVGPNHTYSTTKKLKLHDCCSVYQAELLAISQCLQNHLNKITPTHNNTTHIILSDSKSALQELANPNSYNSLANTIHKLLHTHKQHSHTHFYWVKAHCGIAGNELADAAAKAAANLKKTPDYLTIPISNIKYKLKQIAQQSAEQLYNSPDNCKYTKKIFIDYEAATNTQPCMA